MLPCVGPIAERIPEKSIAVGKRKWIRQSATAVTQPDLSALANLAVTRTPKKEKEGTSAHRTHRTSRHRSRSTGATARTVVVSLRLAGSAVGGIIGGVRRSTGWPGIG